MTVDKIYLKLSAQRALLGNVFPELRAVCVNSKDNLIQVIFYIDGEISEDQIECCESVLDEIIADFPRVNVEEKNILKFETPFIRLDYPLKPPLIGDWVYYRHENISEDKI